jgi:phospholipid transport system transporter-binding protein
MKLPATATLEQASALVREVDGALAAGSGPVVIDASALHDLDTSTIAVLLHARRRAVAAGRGFVVEGAPEQLAQLARLYGVEALLSLAPGAPA